MHNNHHTENDELRLCPQDERFPMPEKLKRANDDELSISRWNELCIGMAENCLTDEETQLVHSWMKEDEASRQLVNAYQKLILKSDNALTFSEKNSLKHQITGRIAWIGTVAAAAVIAILFTIYTFRNEQQTILSNTNPNIVAVAAVTLIPDTNPAIDSTTLIQKEVAPKTDVKEVKKTRQPVSPKPEEKQAQKDSGEPGRSQARTLQPDIKRLPARQPVLLANIEPITAVELVLPDSQPDITSATSIVPVKVKSFLDQLTEKAIVGVNRVFNKETIVVKEYNPEGELTFLAVQSNLFNMERSYRSKQESKQ